MSLSREFELEAAAAFGRSERNSMLVESDWVAIRASELGEAVPDAWKAYRKACRDLPTHSNWPELEEADWPTKPS